nr:sodium:alanine symporter family protein [Maliibacterium massiliense]
MEAFTETVARVNGYINDFVWGPVMLVLLVGTGIWLSARTGFFQVRRFGHIMKNTVGRLFKRREKQADKGAMTPFQALSTALAATVGTGNVAGVATAIATGGPGAVFWMWISAFFGMMTKYAEVVLAVKYRQRNAKGEWVGGPMYYITNGLGKGWKWLAVVFCLFGVFASFGIGNIAQIDSIAGSVESVLVSAGALPGVSTGFSYTRLITGFVVAFLVGLVIIGGLKRIGRLNERLVPFMSVVYIVSALVVICFHAGNILPALGSIFRGAFTLKAAAGGIFGYTIAQAMRYGVARGVFSNEAGLGSAPIAHATADVKDPVKQGLYGVFEVFMDTIVICTLTSLVILCSGVFGGVDPATQKAALDGVPLTIAGFTTVYGGVASVVIAVALFCFAFSTLVSWSFYGQRCYEYLFGSKTVIIYQMLFVCVIVLGSTMGLKLVWDISDTLNGLMAIPNLIAVLGLSPVVFKMTREYSRRLRERDLR